MTTYVVTYAYGGYTHEEILDEFSDLEEATKTYHQLLKDIKEADFDSWEVDSVALEQWTGSPSNDDDSEFQKELMTKVFNEFQE